MPPRRSHKKSRQGCQQCKRRHLKCDESRPACINCKTAQLRCPYERDGLPVDTSLPPTPAETTQNTVASLTSTPARSPVSTYTSTSEHRDDGNTSLNMLHLELMYWWSTTLYKSFVANANVPHAYAEICINYGVRFPFLMRQILSTSALHLSITRSEQRNFYHQHATQLQSEAAAGYNSILEKLDESNIVAAFLMSSLLGLHVFCDTFLFRDADFSHTLDALLGCMSLLRGVRVVIGNWWTYLVSSELNVILMDASSKHQRGIDNTFQSEDLERLISGADISDASRKIYRETIDELGHLFAMQAGLPEPEIGQSANMIFAWLVVAPQEYAELLSARRPEALIILSYYAVVLHHRRSFWAVGDAGKYLIDAIGTHLGRHWDAWLAWPRSMVAS